MSEKKSCKKVNRDKFVRYEEGAKMYHMGLSKFQQQAKDAKACYKLSRITLVRMDRLEVFMKHMRKVPGSLKMVQKEFVRIGEGSIIYSIGRHRFIEMARAAGAVYKINEGTGGTVLVNLELFDKYLEQFRQETVKMKNPLLEKEE